MLKRKPLKTKTRSIKRNPDKSKIHDIKMIAFTDLFENYPLIRDQIYDDDLADSDLTWGSNPHTLIKLSQLLKLVNVDRFNERQDNEYSKFLTATKELRNIFVDLEN